MKKSWHPGLIKNRAQVWEDQHAALQERKRIEALKKEIEEERAANELQKLNEANGGTKRQERVDFLYAGPGAGAGMAEDREAYLLGRKRIDDVLGKDSMGQEVGQIIAAAPRPEDGGPNLRDVANKVALDPLLAIKRQEASQYQALVNKKKAEMEAEARKAARREARRATDNDKYRTSRHSDSHRLSRRDDDDDQARSRRHDHSSRRRRSYSRERDYDRHRSSRRDRERSPERSHRSPRHRSPSKVSHYGERRQHSRSRTHTHDDRRTSAPLRKRSRSPNRSLSHSASRTHPVKETETSRTSASKSDRDDGDERARKLAEMMSAASDLDKVRNERLEEAKLRDQEQRAIEQTARAREAHVGQSSAFVRKMQLSTGLAR